MGFLSAREKAGLTQATVASKLGVTGAAVSYWETGKNLPRGKLLGKIALLYGCTVDELLRSDDTDSTGAREAHTA